MTTSTHEQFAREPWLTYEDTLSCYATSGVLRFDPEQAESEFQKNIVNILKYPEAVTANWANYKLACRMYDHFSPALPESDLLIHTMLGFKCNSFSKAGQPSDFYLFFNIFVDSFHSAKSVILARKRVFMHQRARIGDSVFLDKPLGDDHLANSYITGVNCDHYVASGTLRRSCGFVEKDGGKMLYMPRLSYSFEAGLITSLEKRLRSHSGVTEDGTISDKALSDLIKSLAFGGENWQPSW